MAINIKPIDLIQKKFAARASAAGADYKNGVENPRRSQSAAAIAAKGAWADAVQAAIASGRFEKGLTRSGDAKWQANASSIGAQRFPQGAANAAPAFGANVGPYIQVLSGLTLPPRFPRGDPRNNDRVAAVTAALHQKKMQS